MRERRKIVDLSNSHKTKVFIISVCMEGGFVILRGKGSAYKYEKWVCVWDENGKNNKIINKNSMIFRQNFYCCYKSKSNFISTDHDLLSDQRNFKEKENEKFYAESFLLNVCTVEERKGRKEKYLQVICCCKFQTFFVTYNLIALFTAFILFSAPLCIASVKNAIKIDTKLLLMHCTALFGKSLINVNSNKAHD